MSLLPDLCVDEAELEGEDEDFLAEVVAGDEEGDVLD